MRPRFFETIFLPPFLAADLFFLATFCLPLNFFFPLPFFFTVFFFLTTLFLLVFFFRATLAATFFLLEFLLVVFDFLVADFFTEAFFFFLVFVFLLVAEEALLVFFFLRPPLAVPKALAQLSEYCCVVPDRRIVISKNFLGLKLPMTRRALAREGSLNRLLR